MAVPRNRASNRRKNMKRAHQSKKVPTLATCPNCEQFIQPHTVCSSCGRYNNRQVLPPKEEG